MSESISARLRQLARDHYEGRIAYDAYVRSRGAILDSLVGIDAASIEDTAVITQPRRITGEFSVSTGEHAAAPPAAKAEASAAEKPDTQPETKPVTATVATPDSAATPAAAEAKETSPAAPEASEGAPAAPAESATPAAGADPTRRPAPAEPPATPKRRSSDGSGAAAPSQPDAPRQERRRSQSKPAPSTRPATGPHSSSRPPPPIAPAPQTAPPKASRSVSAFAIGGIVALVLGIAVSWLWISGAYLKLLGRESAPVAATADSSAAARLLVDEFLLANDWSDATVAQFNFHWKTLAIEERRAAFESIWLPEFIEAVRSRVKEQRALSAGEAGQRTAGPLAELAATFGIDVSAPDRVILPAAILQELSPPPVPASTTASATSSPHAEVKPAVASSETRTAPTPAATRTPPATTPAPAPQRREATPARTATPTPATAPPAAATATAPAGVAGEKQTQRECSLVPVRSRKPLCQDPLSIGGFGPAISLISVAPFAMGSTAAAEERPVRTVTLARPFGLSMYEISQREFRTYCAATGRNCPEQPSAGDELPVVNVTWNEARSYAEWLSSATGQRYRLPSEAEWEFAARAGETAIYPQNIQLAPSDAWFSGAERRSGVGPRNAGKLNAFNVAHMLGNAREWVLDGWTPNHEGAPPDGTARSPDAAGNRVVRGGSYVDTAPRLRLSLRDRLAADTRDPTTGFRVAREIP